MDCNFSPFLRFVSKTTYFINDTVITRDCRILYILSGTGSFEHSGNSIKLSPNTLVFYPCETVYRISSEKGMLFYTLNFDFNQDHAEIKTMTPKSPGSFQPSEALRTIPSELNDCFSRVMSFENALWAVSDIERIYTESLQQAGGYTQIRDAYLKILLINIFRRKPQDSANSLLCDKIKDFIATDLRRNIKELAAALNYHPFYLNEVFKKNEGITLHKYLAQQRLIKANELISTTQMPLGEIAQMCGFSSQAHLSASFKKAFCVSPGHLRRQV